MSKSTPPPIAPGTTPIREILYKQLRLALLEIDSIEKFGQTLLNKLLMRINFDRFNIEKYANFEDIVHSLKRLSEQFNLIVQ